MLIKIGLVAMTALALLLGYAATRPDVFRVQRVIDIKAPPEKIFPLVNDLRAFNRWSPYIQKDPAVHLAYRGAATGPGSGYDFAGNKDVGKGQLDITHATAPTSVTLQLHMIEPFEGRNTVEFTLVPRGDVTQVTWAMHGPSPYISKLVGVFIDMDQMIGKDFATGLANLKSLAERG